MRRALIVEDQESWLTEIKKVLGPDWDIEWVQDVKSAITTIDSYPQFDLIVLDAVIFHDQEKVSFDQDGGFRIAEHINHLEAKKRGRPVVVVCTRRLGLSEMERAKKASADFIYKADIAKELPKVLRKIQ